MTDATTIGLSTPDRNDLREYLRRIREGETAGFENRRIGDSNTQTYDVGPGTTVTVRETSDAALDLHVRIETSSAPVADPLPETLPAASDDIAALGDTLTRLVNDVFDIPVDGSDFDNLDNHQLGTGYQLTIHLPSRSLIE